MESLVVDWNYSEISQSSSDHRIRPVQHEGAPQILEVEIRKFPDQIFVENLSASAVQKIEIIILGHF